jgi:hypothetical protein
MPDLHRLVQTAPPNIAELFAVPGRAWTRDARLQVVEWLAQPDHLASLRDMVHAGFNVSREDADDIVAAYLEELVKRPSRLARYNPPKPSVALTAGRAFAGFIGVDLRRFATDEVRELRVLKARGLHQRLPGYARVYAPSEPTASFTTSTNAIYSCCSGSRQQRLRSGS